jgi:hypothetical protein
MKVIIWAGVSNEVINKRKTIKRKNDMDIFSVRKNIPNPDKTSDEIEYPAYDPYNPKFNNGFDNHAMGIFRTKTPVIVFPVWVLKRPRPIAKYWLMHKGPETSFPNFSSCVKGLDLSANVGYLVLHFRGPTADTSFVIFIKRMLWQPSHNPHDMEDTFHIPVYYRQYHRSENAKHCEAYCYPACCEDQTGQQSGS